MSKKLENRVVVITGATSGMALATAKLFVEEGAYVFVTGRSQERLDKAVKKIGKTLLVFRAMLAVLQTSIGCSRRSKRRRVALTSSLLAPAMVKSVSHLAPLPRRASTIRSTLTFAGPCLPCKRLCRL